MPATGGTSVYAEGTAAFESSEQKARSAPAHAGNTSRRGKGLPAVHGLQPHPGEPGHRRMQVDNTAETSTSTSHSGSSTPTSTIYAYDQPNELYTFHRPEGLGAQCQELLLKASQNAGVDIFTSTPAKKIVMKDGVVAGVMAEDSAGNTMHIACKAVILASGGFGNNLDREEVLVVPPHGRRDVQMCSEENTGDGLTMALEAGADTESLGAVMIIACARGKTLTSHTSGAGSQPVLWIDKAGRRFANEEVAMSFADTGNNIAKQPDGVVYAIIDSDTVQHLMEKGSESAWATSSSTT